LGSGLGTSHRVFELNVNLELGGIQLVEFMRLGRNRLQ
jgi:hypothetical protein